MKRDFDLIRDLLLDIEANQEPGKRYIPEMEGYDTITLHEHLIILEGAGLITGQRNPTKTPGQPYRVKSITGPGYDFLDQIRETGTWSKIKGYIKSKGATITIETIKVGASAVIKSLLE